MDDTYVYISVKLYLAEGQTEDSVQDIIQVMGYSFEHDDIIGHEIMDILDMQLPNDAEPDSEDLDSILFNIDPFEMPEH